MRGAIQGVADLAGQAAQMFEAQKAEAQAERDNERVAQLRFDYERRKMEQSRALADLDPEAMEKAAATFTTTFESEIAGENERVRDALKGHVAHDGLLFRQQAFTLAQKRLGERAKADLAAETQAFRDAYATADGSQRQGLFDAFADAIEAKRGALGDVAVEEALAGAGEWSKETQAGEAVVRDPAGFVAAAEAGRLNHLGEKLPELVEDARAEIGRRQKAAEQAMNAARGDNASVLTLAVKRGQIGEGQIEEASQSGQIDIRQRTTLLLARDAFVKQKRKEAEAQARAAAAETDQRGKYAAKFLDAALDAGAEIKDFGAHLAAVQQSDPTRAAELQARYVVAQVGATMKPQALREQAEDMPADSLEQLEVRKAMLREAERTEAALADDPLRHFQRAGVAEILPLDTSSVGSFQESVGERIAQAARGAAHFEMGSAPVFRPEEGEHLTKLVTEADPQDAVGFLGIFAQMEPETARQSIEAMALPPEVVAVADIATVDPRAATTLLALTRTQGDAAATDRDAIKDVDAYVDAAIEDSIGEVIAGQARFGADPERMNRIAGGRKLVRQAAQGLIATGMDADDAAERANELVFGHRRYLSDESDLGFVSFPKDVEPEHLEDGLTALRSSLTVDQAAQTFGFDGDGVEGRMFAAGVSDIRRHGKWIDDGEGFALVDPATQRTVMRASVDDVIRASVGDGSPR